MPAFSRVIFHVSRIETSYSVSLVGDEKIFQIQTYGPRGYEAGAKQVIQFDKKRAVQLIDILRIEYNL